MSSESPVYGACFSIVYDSVVVQFCSGMLLNQEKVKTIQKIMKHLHHVQSGRMEGLRAGRCALEAELLLGYSPWTAENTNKRTNRPTDKLQQLSPPSPPQQNLPENKLQDGSHTGCLYFYIWLFVYVYQCV